MLTSLLLIAIVGEEALTVSVKGRLFTNSMARMYRLTSIVKLLETGR